MLDWNTRPQRILTALLGGLVIGLGCAACGGSTSKSSSTTSVSSTTAATQAPPKAPSAGQGTPSVTTGSVRGTLRGENHAPKVNQDWRYWVTVTDAGGHPLSGTVDIEFAFGGQVVGHDTPPTHPVAGGHWHDSLKFPADAVGMPLSLHAVVHTRPGSITLDWPIKVRQ